MNGRFFDGKRLIAEFYDGFTNYFVPETDEEKAERDKRWEKWLEGNEEYEERIAAEKIRQAQDEDAEESPTANESKEQKDVA